MSDTFESLNSMDVYEINEDEIVGIEKPKLVVSNHFIRKQFVVIEVAGVKYTVIADELKRAIDNAQNAHR